MSAAAIGPRRYVAPVSVQVPTPFGAPGYVQLLHDHWGGVWIGSADEADALAGHLKAAAEQARAEAAARRLAQHAEVATRARLHRLLRCERCPDAQDGADGLCALCRDAEQRAERITGEARA